MVDSIDEELELMRERAEEPSSMSVEEFQRPIEKLFSKPAIAVDVSATVGDAVSRMRDNAYGAIVVTRDGKLAGIITERDLVVKVLGGTGDFRTMLVSEVMTPNPVSLQKEEPTASVAHHMHAGGYRHVPIVDENDVPVSIVSIKDVVRYILNFFPNDIMNASIENIEPVQRMR